jgi:hypothetical protein
MDSIEIMRAALSAMMLQRVSGNMFYLRSYG